MKVVAIAALASALAPASAYLITGDDVNCRSGPGTSYAVKKTYAKGTDVKISCQTAGTTVNGNSIWDKTSDGCYVSDYYVKTGSNGYVTGKCEGTSTCVAPKSNQATVDLIAASEGFVPNVYIDATGHPTVGYGHLCSSSKCSDVKYKIPLSQADGKKLLADDMKKFEKCITQMCKAKLNLNQYGALISWSFNMGCGAAQGSQLIKRLNAGEDPNTVIAQELPKWVHDGNGNVLKGLVTRRNNEIKLAKTPTDDKALPPKC
ncbi:lysozyme-like domain-containing protein [Achaetomium macrosporum]|uniref:Lysozyme-like domain-containing protein n=1 Tax=Achaetomium macrosporum TaxID=79813 RepID=A0AAN7HCB0_9PEZI|nr:lysozyme-like domain-containing protein [Achaetomium macrosporum]